MKRHKEINSLLKENKLYKDQVDGIRRKFGDLGEIQNKFDLALMKEQKVSDLLAELDHTMKSTENQLACYKCMNLLDLVFNKKMNNYYVLLATSNMGITHSF